jgi:hypothetical protein
MVSEVIAFIKESFPEAIVHVDTDSKSADIFIDCLEDKQFEVTLDVRTFGVRIGKMDKSIELGDFSSFDFSFFDLEEVKRFLLNCKSTGQF